MTLAKEAVAPIVTWFGKQSDKNAPLRGDERKQVLADMKATGCFDGKSDTQVCYFDAMTYINESVGAANIAKYCIGIRNWSA